MRFYVYFDGYGRAKNSVNEDYLKIVYDNKIINYFNYMINREKEGHDTFVYGHVGVITCADENEFYDYLNSLGDEIEGLYEGNMDVRPYNF